MFLLPLVFTIDLVAGILVYLFGAVGIILTLWFYFDLRDRNVYEGERKKNIYHCIKCDKIYTDKPKQETAPCPRCGYRNIRLKF
ncbi:MAG: hydrogenase nickel incorporation protein HypA [Opitutales bacterium]